MTQEDKLLLLKDICMRLPYNVVCQFEDDIRLIGGVESPYYDYVLSEMHIELFKRHDNFFIKPYLRPMSSMTEEEEYWYYSFIDRKFYYESASELVNWLLKNHFDFQGLIPKGLALVAPEGMYN